MTVLADKWFGDFAPLVTAKLGATWATRATPAEKREKSAISDAAPLLPTLCNTSATWATDLTAPAVAVAHVAHLLHNGSEAIGQQKKGRKTAGFSASFARVARVAPNFAHVAHNETKGGPMISVKALAARIIARNHEGPAARVPPFHPLESGTAEQSPENGRNLRKTSVPPPGTKPPVWNSLAEAHGKSWRWTHGRGPVSNLLSDWRADLERTRVAMASRRAPVNVAARSLAANLGAIYRDATGGEVLGTKFKCVFVPACIRPLAKSVRTLGPGAIVPLAKAIVANIRRGRKRG